MLHVNNLQLTNIESTIIKIKFLNLNWNLNLNSRMFKTINDAMFCA